MTPIEYLTNKNLKILGMSIGQTNPFIICYEDKIVKISDGVAEFLDITPPELTNRWPNIEKGEHFGIDYDIWFEHFGDDFVYMLAETKYKHMPNVTGNYEYYVFSNGFGFYIRDNGIISILPNDPSSMGIILSYFRKSDCEIGEFYDFAWLNAHPEGSPLWGNEHGAVKFLGYDRLKNIEYCARCNQRIRWIELYFKCTVCHKVYG